MAVLTVMALEAPEINTSTAPLPPSFWTLNFLTCGESHGFGYTVPRDGG